MEWKEFKKTVESQGITDDTDIAYIDTDFLFDVKVDMINLDWVTIS